MLGCIVLIAHCCCFPWPCVTFNRIQQTLPHLRVAFVVKTAHSFRNCQERLGFDFAWLPLDLATRASCRPPHQKLHANFFSGGDNEGKARHGSTRSKKNKKKEGGGANSIFFSLPSEHSLVGLPSAGSTRRNWYGRGRSTWTSSNSWALPPPPPWDPPDRSGT